MHPSTTPHPPPHLGISPSAPGLGGKCLRGARGHPNPYLTSGLYRASLSKYRTALPRPTLMKPMRGMSCREREREKNEKYPNKMNIYQADWRVKGRADTLGDLQGKYGKAIL